MSNADRVVFPDDGITKGEVVAYYGVVSEHMWPFLDDRALTVERFPQGTGAKGFMQKNAPGHFKDDLIRRHEVPKEEGGVTEYPVPADPKAVPAFANLGVITFHVPPSTVSDPRHPDWVIWDLDPAPDSLAMVRTAAVELRDVLGTFGVATGLMTSGSSGYHLRARIEPTVEANDVAMLTRGLSALAAAAHPDLMTLEFRKVERKGRVFVDWLRNAPYSTSVVPWSLRARPGAPVAVPMSWDELLELAPDGIKFTDALERLQTNPWAGLAPLDLSSTVSKVEDALSEADIVLPPFDRFRS